MKESQFLGQTTEELTLLHGEYRERIIQEPEKNHLETLQECITSIQNSTKTLHLQVRNLAAKVSLTNHLQPTGNYKNNRCDSIKY